MTTQRSEKTGAMMENRSGRRAGPRAMRLGIIALLCSSGAAMAEPLATLKADINRDGAPDVVELRAGADDIDTDLHIAYGDSAAPPKKFTNVAWRGALYGNRPKLELGPQGSIILISQKTGIGRWKWIKKLTIAYRNNALYVAGYSYAGWDAFEPISIDCDINLLTGGAIRDDKRFRVRPRRIKLSDWAEHLEPPECAPPG